MKTIARKTLVNRTSFARFWPPGKSSAEQEKSDEAIGVIESVLLGYQPMVRAKS
jgi:hypothetical protein